MNNAESDLVILKVAFLLSAVDGRIDESERAMFRKLSEQCKDIDVKAAEKIVPEMEAAAIQLAGAKAALSEKAFLDLFMKEVGAFCDWPAFVKNSIQVRKAFVMWIAMSTADGDFSAIERKALLRIRKLVNSFEMIDDGFLCAAEKHVMVAHKAVASLSKASTLEASKRVHERVDRAYSALSSLIG